MSKKESNSPPDHPKPPAPPSPPIESVERYCINNADDRRRVVVAFVMAGYKVWIVVETRQTHRLNPIQANHYVCVESKGD